MKKKDIVGAIAIVLTWLLIIAGGVVIWETPIDAYEGILMGIVISVLTIICFGREPEQYDEYGNYRG